MTPKNMLLPVLLEILGTRSDAKHPLSQKKILDILEGGYGMVIDRKTLSRNLRELAEFCGGRIVMNERPRSMKDAKTGENIETSMQTGFYMARDFDDSELMALIYSVIFSRHIPTGYKRDLIKRLEKLGSLDLHTEMNSFAMLPADDESGSKEFFLNMDLLNEAILNRKKAVYRRKVYGTGKTPVILEEEITFTPFKIAEKNDDFYVIGARDTDRLYRVRIDSMTGVKILDEPGLDLYKITGIDKSFDFSSFLSKSPTLVPSKVVRAKLYICGFYPLSDAIDYFGPESITAIKEENPDETREHEKVYTVSVRCSERALMSWVIHPSNRTHVVEPPELRDRIRHRLQSQVYAYNKDPQITPDQWKYINDRISDLARNAQPDFPEE